jgi:hypothetical protein
VARHETLRACCIFADDQAWQTFRDTPPERQETDLRDLPLAQARAKAEHMANLTARAPFNLSEPPLLQSLVIRLTDREVVWVVVTHHIAADGWSVGVLERELSMFYSARVSGQPAGLEPLAAQVVDIARWQAGRVPAAARTEQLAYWTETLAGAPALELPTDFARPRGTTWRGGWHPFSVPADTDAAATTLSRACGTTRFVVFLAAFKALIHRWSGAEDIVVATACSNRNHVAAEPLIGCFANHLALRTEVAARETFRELLAREQAVVSAAFAHQDVPFNEIVDALNLPRDVSRNPVFQAVFTLHRRAADETLQLPGVELELLPADMGTGRVDLNLAIVEDRDGLTGSLEFSGDLYTRDTVTRLCRHYLQLLASAVAAPDTALSPLPLVPAPERAALTL